jgi:adenylosuccinate lyase
LATTKVLITAVRHGVGRETAHEAIKEHSVEAALQMRETGRSDNDLLDRLAADPRLGITRAELEAAIANPIQLTGTAGQQVAALAAQIEAIAAAHPEAAAYRPGPVL